MSSQYQSYHNSQNKLNINYISANRPLPFQVNPTTSTREIIKMNKELAINENTYNKYFKDYYSITEEEKQSSNIYKLLQNTALFNHNKKSSSKSNLQMLVNLTDNNTYMEVNFLKNFQSRKDKSFFKLSKIAKESIINNDNSTNLPMIHNTTNFEKGYRTCPSQFVVFNNANNNIALNSKPGFYKNIMNSKIGFNNSNYANSTVTTTGNRVIDKFSNTLNNDSINRKNKFINLINNNYSNNNRNGSNDNEVYSLTKTNNNDDFHGSQKEVIIKTLYTNNKDEAVNEIKMINEEREIIKKSLILTNESNYNDNNINTINTIITYKSLKYINISDSNRPLNDINTNKNNSDINNANKTNTISNENDGEYSKAIETGNLENHNHNDDKINQIEEIMKCIYSQDLEKAKGMLFNDFELFKEFCKLMKQSNKSNTNNIINSNNININDMSDNTQDIIKSKKERDLVISSSKGNIHNTDTNNTNANANISNSNKSLNIQGSNNQIISKSLFNTNNETNNINNSKSFIHNIRDYLNKHLANRTMSLELKPFKIEFYNYDDVNFYQKEFYLPFEISVMFYFINEFNILLILSQLYTYLGPKKGFSFKKDYSLYDIYEICREVKRLNDTHSEKRISSTDSKSELDNYMIDYEMLTNTKLTNINNNDKNNNTDRRSNSKVKRNINNNNTNKNNDNDNKASNSNKLVYLKESMNFYWIFGETTYNIKLSYPRINLKFKNKNIKFTKLVTVDMFCEFITKNFNKWDYYCIDSLLNIKSFRNIFLLELNNKNTRYQDDIILDKLITKCLTHDFLDNNYYLFIESLLKPEEINENNDEENELEDEDENENEFDDNENNNSDINKDKNDNEEIDNEEPNVDIIEKKSTNIFNNNSLLPVINKESKLVIKTNKNSDKNNNNKTKNARFAQNTVEYKKDTSRNKQARFSVNNNTEISKESKNSKNSKYSGSKKYKYYSNNHSALNNPNSNNNSLNFTNRVLCIKGRVISMKNKQSKHFHVTKLLNLQQTSKVELLKNHWALLDFFKRMIYYKKLPVNSIRQNSIKKKTKMLKRSNGITNQEITNLQSILQKVSEKDIKATIKNDRRGTILKSQHLYNNNNESPRRKNSIALNYFSQRSPFKLSTFNNKMTNNNSSTKFNAREYEMDLELSQLNNIQKEFIDQLSHSGKIFKSPSQKSMFSFKILNESNYNNNDDGKKNEEQYELETKEASVLFIILIKNKEFGEFEIKLEDKKFKKDFTEMLFSSNQTTWKSFLTDIIFEECFKPKEILSSRTENLNIKPKFFRGKSKWNNLKSIVDDASKNNTNNLSDTNSMMNNSFSKQESRRRKMKIDSLQGNKAKNKADLFYSPVKSKRDINDGFDINESMSKFKY